MINSKLIPTARSRDGGKNKIKREKYICPVATRIPDLLLFHSPPFYMYCSGYVIPKYIT